MIGKWLEYIRLKVDNEENDKVYVSYNEEIRFMKNKVGL